MLMLTACPRCNETTHVELVAFEMHPWTGMITNYFCCKACPHDWHVTEVDEPIFKPTLRRRPRGRT